MMTPPDIARALGISETRVENWAKRGWLVPDLPKVQGRTGCPRRFVFTERAVFTFVQTHAFWLTDARPTEYVWIKALIAARADFIDGPTLERRLCVTAGWTTRKQRDHGFPKPFRSGKRRWYSRSAVEAWLGREL